MLNRLSFCIRRELDRFYYVDEMLRYLRSRLSLIV
jgi:hypothetical protein